MTMKIKSVKSADPGVSKYLKTVQGKRDVKVLKKVLGRVVSHSDAVRRMQA